jgi:acetolactate synthase regulatory subunit
MVISLTSLMSKGASLEAQEIRIDLAVFPETSCQGLFNQIHKKATKKVPEALSCS